MHIGLIGGIGPGATDFYYRRLISTFARKNATLELTIVHADTPTLLSNLTKNDAAAQTAIYIPDSQTAWFRQRPHVSASHRLPDISVSTTSRPYPRFPPLI